MPTKSLELGVASEQKPMTLCEADTFQDPEHIRCELNDTHENPQDVQRGRLLTKRDAHRLLNRTETPAGPKSAADPAARRPLNRDENVAGSVVVTARSQSNVVLTIMTDRRRDANGEDVRYNFAGPATSAPSMPLTAQTTVARTKPRQVEVKTPRDVVYLDMVLDGRLLVDFMSEARWVHTMINQLMPQAEPMGLRVPATSHSDVCRTQPRIEDAPGVMTVSPDSAGRRVAQDQDRDESEPQVSAGCGADPLSEGQPLIPQAAESVSAGAQEAVAGVEPVSSDRPRSRRRRARRRRPATHPLQAEAAVVRGTDWPCKQGVGSPRVLELAGALGEMESPKIELTETTCSSGGAVCALGGAGSPMAGPDLVWQPDTELSDSSPRKVRRSRRKRKAMVPLQPSEPGGGGGYDPRGVQMSCTSGELGRLPATALEADSPRLVELPEAVRTTAKSGVSADHGSTVPVQVQGVDRHLPQRPRQAPEHTKTGQQGPTRDRTAENNLGWAYIRTGTLSQQREFQGKRPRFAVRHSQPQQGLSITVVRGQKGRLVAKAIPPVEHSLRMPRPDTTDMTGLKHEMARRGPAGRVSDRFPEQAASPGDPPPPSAVQMETALGVGRGHKRTGHKHTRSIHGSPVSGGPPAEQVAGPRLPQGETLSWAERQIRKGKRSWSRPANLGGGEVLTQEQTGTERLTLEDVIVTESTIDGLREVQPRPDRVTAADRAGQEASTPEGDRISGRPDWESDSAPASVEGRLVRGEVLVRVVVRKSDWDEMEDLGMGPHPQLVIGLAWRRQYADEYRERQRMPNVRFVSHDAFDLPRDAWPTSWEGLVQHVRHGGFFRSSPVLRGGMDDEQQRVLDNTVFDENLPWDELDQAMAGLRSGQPVPPQVSPDVTRLAQVLVGQVPLQQWDRLSGFMRSLHPNVLENILMTPARLAALRVLAQRMEKNRPDPAPPPAWVFEAPFTDLRFHNLSPEAFVPGVTRELKEQLLDAILNRLLSVAPEIKQHPLYKLQDIRGDMRLELNNKEPGYFSLTAILPTGPYITDLYKGVRSLAEGSFCTIGPTDLYIETEVSNLDRQVLFTIMDALELDQTTFRLILDESLGKAFNSNIVRSRNATVRFVEGNRGGKRTMEHVDPGSLESRLLVTLDGTSLLLARRHLTSLPLRLGWGQEFPVTIGLTLPHCPHQALRSMLLPRDPATIKQRGPGTVIDSPVVLVGPLPKGTLPAQAINSGTRMAEVRRSINGVCSGSIGTRDARFVGKYDKDRSPMFLCMEFASLDAARHFGSMIDQGVPPEFATVMIRLFGDKVAQAQFWCCSVVSEVFAGVDEKTMKALMTHGQAHPCPLPPPQYAPPPLPPNPQAIGGQNVNGTGAAANAADNPGPAGH